ncbi:myeloid cell surface antigen CD33-like [Hyperolius riggenbachi]|uniref:myeloid cell surface antigen CD33-like n=1 Tax=Hyperolius riggenbachi TaxID=752182 RepID=UPI0035A2E52A
MEQSISEFQGMFVGLFCQQWEFPSEIVALIGSCVEIPCTFFPRNNVRAFSPVWYLYDRQKHEIFNDRSSASVLREYKGRTSLVPGRRSCALRIHPVRREDRNDYYPGIARVKNINAYTQRRMLLRLLVTDSPQVPNLHVPHFMVEGVHSNITCSVQHTCGTDPPSLSWNRPGKPQRLVSYLGGGSWRETSVLMYVPSHEDNGTVIQCMATYHNGITSQKAITLNIKLGQESGDTEAGEEKPNEEDTETGGEKSHDEDTEAGDEKSNDEEGADERLPSLYLVALICLPVFPVAFYLYWR